MSLLTATQMSTFQSTSSVSDDYLTVSRQRMNSRFDALEDRIALLSLGSGNATELTKQGDEIAIEAQKITTMLMESCPNNPSATSMAQSIRKTVSSTIEDAMRNHVLIPRPLPETHDTSILCADKRSSYVQTKYYRTVFGTLRIRTTRTDRATGKKRTSTYHDVLAPHLETEIFFCPRLWLSTKAISILMEWAPSYEWSLCRLEMRSYLVIAFDSPIMEACLEGNIISIKALAEQGLPLRRVLDSQGRNLIAVSCVSRNLIFAGSHF